jgi:hypothetical protein
LKQSTLTRPEEDTPVPSDFLATIVLVAIALIAIVLSLQERAVPPRDVGPMVVHLTRIDGSNAN